MPGDGKAVRWIEVTEEEAGQRIDNYLLARLKGVPKSHVYRVLRSGEVRVNSRRVEASLRVSAGDRIRVPPVRTAQREETVPAPHFRLPILFEDEAFLAIDKPAGLAVHGGSGIAHGVIESLRSMRPQARFLELVHRLDRETSGVLLVARKRSALTALHALLRARAVDKRYLVGVRGRFRNESQRVQARLAARTQPAGGKRVSVSESGQEAETIFRRLARGEEFSLLEAQLLTGRTHQIRVHLAHVKHPVLGDDKYGDFDLNKRLRREGLKRMFLHAHSLAFAHPATGAPVRIESPLPRELLGVFAPEHRGRRMSAYDLVIFDWDGTLMDSTRVIAASLQDACRDVGCPVPTREEALYVIGLNMADTFARVVPDLDEAGRHRLAERYRVHFLAREHEAPLFEGVRPMLGELHAGGWRMAVATGKARRGLERALEATGLKPWFEATRCADEGFAKPHPGMLLALLDLTGVDPARALMVGDTTHDLELAANAGVDAVAVSYGAHPESLLESRPARARVGSVQELHRWLTTNG